MSNACTSICSLWARWGYGTWHLCNPYQSVQGGPYQSVQGGDKIVGRLCLTERGIWRVAQIGLPHGGMCRMWVGLVANIPNDYSTYVFHQSLGDVSSKLLMGWQMKETQKKGLKKYF